MALPDLFPFSSNRHTTSNSRACEYAPFRLKELVGYPLRLASLGFQNALPVLGHHTYEQPIQFVLQRLDALSGEPADAHGDRTYIFG